jgi:hypothetical protein
MSADQQHEPLALTRTYFKLQLSALSKNESGYTVEQLITALEATTTLTTLNVIFGCSFEPTAENSRRIVAPLCRCIANLRLYNKQHPLKKLELGYASHCNNSNQNGMYLDMFEQFLVAAKRFGISHLAICAVFNPIPTQFLLEFCRENRHLRVLEIDNVSFTESRDAVAWPPNNRSQGASHNLHLDELNMESVRFFNEASAASFGIFLAHLSVSVMKFGALTAYGDNECDKIVSEFIVPSVEQLTLAACISFDHVKAALNAATATATNLTVGTCCDNNSNTSSRDKVLETLTSLICGAAKLQSLTVKEIFEVPIILPSRMIEAMEGCATITQVSLFHEDYNGDLCLDDPQNPEIRRILARNNELARFVASPSTYPTHRLPFLIVQFDQCPSGRYMLARRLPEMLSFQHLGSTNSDSLTESTQK